MFDAKKRTNSAVFQVESDQLHGTFGKWFREAGHFHKNIRAKVWALEMIAAHFKSNLTRSFYSIKNTRDFHIIYNNYNYETSITLKQNLYAGLMPYTD